MIKISIQKDLEMVEGRRPLIIDLEIKQGAYVVVHGPSGAGKTSLLRMIAGLLKPEKGDIQVDGEQWFSAGEKIHLPARKRRLGFVFQDLALFPNMSVMGNMLFAAGDKKDVGYLERLLTVSGMKPLADRMPMTLSGGQQQRLALIRALARRPRLLLLDEPFSKLDKQMGFQLRTELWRLHRELDLTTILVSHDPMDINGKADAVVEIKKGRAICVEGDEGLCFAKNYTGKVVGLYAYGDGYIVEIDLGNETLKMPVNKNTAGTLKQGATVSVYFDDGNIRIARVC